jgi:hypothetical protein
MSEVGEVIFKPGEAQHLSKNPYAAFRVARSGLVEFLANSEELEDLLKRARGEVAKWNGGELRFSELPEYAVFANFSRALDEAREAAIEALMMMYKGELDGLARQLKKLVELDSELWRVVKEVYSIVRKYDDVLAEKIYWHPTLTRGLAVVAEDIAKYFVVRKGHAPKGWKMCIELM